MSKDWVSFGARQQLHAKEGLVGIGNTLQMEISSASKALSVASAFSEAFSFIPFLNPSLQPLASLYCKGFTFSIDVHLQL